MGLFSSRTAEMVTPDRALPGRSAPLGPLGMHAVLGVPIVPPFPDDTEQLVIGLGCFWGAERIFWQLPGVVTTAVGYAGGYTPNPTYEEVCSGRTGHAEVVRVVFDPASTSIDALLAAFFEGHDPTQVMRQGNDVGTQYRSVVLAGSPAQREAACAMRDQYEKRLVSAGFARVATEVVAAGEFYYAEDYHQQYLAKHPDGYCGLGGTGVACPVGLLG